MGGELLVYHGCENEPPTVVDIKHNFYAFDGSKYYHEVAEYTGSRITLVYYNCLPPEVSGYLVHGTRQPAGTMRCHFQY